MGLLVQKFGGSSVGDLERIHHVANIIKQTRDAGHLVVAVVSAMQGETDRLIKLAKDAFQEPQLREVDVLIATGEQVSAALLSLSLIALGCPAQSFTGWQAQIRTDTCYGKACITSIDTQPIRAVLQKGVIPVVTGFQGVDDQGQITTFGRGGSDITAVALAVALPADECQIFTDVEGVFTTDPRIVKDARRLSQITFPEMFELASLGAKVMQQNAVEYAQQHHVPLRVLSTFVPGPGTLITHLDQKIGEAIVSGIAFDRDQVKVSVMGINDLANFSKQLERRLAHAAVNVDMLVANRPLQNNIADLSFTIARNEFNRAMPITRNLSEEFSCNNIIVDEHLAKLSLVGLGMKSHAGVATKLLSSLADEGIEIQLIISSEIKISVVIHEKYLELGARTLHSVFNLSQS